jgi:aspartate racemase
MLRIGLIGGMSWESSAEYYRLLNELTRDRFGGLHSAECVLYSVDFADIAAMQASGHWRDAADRLAQAARSLEAAGADLVLICTNTMHKVADEVQAAVTVPLLHLADATAKAVLRREVSTVGLLGTRFTMEQDFYRRRLEEHGLTVLVPTEEDRALVHRVIFSELCVGRVEAASKRAYLDVIDRLAQAGAQGVILGCTEIELLVQPGEGAVPLFPTARLHVEAALEAAGAPEPWRGHAESRRTLSHHTKS